jgi:hypothetical protein
MHVRLIALIAATICSSTISRGQSKQDHPHDATLLVRCNLNCALTVDDEPTIKVAANVLTRVPVFMSEHLVTAVTEDMKDKWEMVVNVDKQQKVVLIDLSNLKRLREMAPKP